MELIELVDAYIAKKGGPPLEGSHRDLILLILGTVSETERVQLGAWLGREIVKKR